MGRLAPPNDEDRSAVPQDMTGGLRGPVGELVLSRGDVRTSSGTIVVISMTHKVKFDTDYIEEKTFCGNFCNKV